MDIEQFIATLKQCKLEKSRVTLTEAELDYVLDSLMFRRSFEFTKQETNELAIQLMRAAADNMERWAKYMRTKQ